MTPIVAGGLINSALFLAGLLVCGLWSNDHAVAAMALASIGSCVVSYTLQMSEENSLRMAAVIPAILSWLLPIAACVVLLRDWITR